MAPTPQGAPAPVKAPAATFTLSAETSFTVKPTSKVKKAKRDDDLNSIHEKLKKIAHSLFADVPTKYKKLFLEFQVLFRFSAKGEISEIWFTKIKSSGSPSSLSDKDIKSLLTDIANELRAQVLLKKGIVSSQSQDLNMSSIQTITLKAE